MNVTNKTRLNTRHITALIRAVAVKECFTAEEIDRLVVRIKYRRRTHCRTDTHPGGYAYYKSNIFCLKFVKGIQPDPVATAKVIAHELAHCQGVHHGSAMRNARYGWEAGWRDTWDWAKDYPLEMRPEVVAVKPTGFEKVEQDVLRCQRALDDWRRKAKMAATKIKKWNAKLRYYEKRKAAMSKPHAESVEQVKRIMAIVTGEKNANDSGQTSNP